jgi:hypothetical protein
VISVKGRDKLLLKVENVKNVKDKKSWKRASLLRFLFKRGFLKISQSPLRVKETSFLMQWLET